MQALECLEGGGAASEAATSAVLVLEVDPIWLFFVTASFCRTVH